MCFYAGISFIRSDLLCRDQAEEDALRSSASSRQQPEMLPSPRPVPAHIPQMGGPLQIAEHMLPPQHRLSWTLAWPCPGLPAPSCPQAMLPGPVTAPLCGKPSSAPLVGKDGSHPAPLMFLLCPSRPSCRLPCPMLLCPMSLKLVLLQVPPPGVTFPKYSCPRLPPLHQMLPPQKAFQLPGPKATPLSHAS